MKAYKEKDKKGVKNKEINAMRTLLNITAVVLAVVSAFVAVKLAFKVIGVSTATYYPVDDNN